LRGVQRSTYLLPGRRRLMSMRPPEHIPQGLKPNHFWGFVARPRRCPFKAG
jgi:hypothetical protein